MHIESNRHKCLLRIASKKTEGYITISFPYATVKMEKGFSIIFSSLCHTQNVACIIFQFQRKQKKIFIF
jgi:hypothetical protein